MTTDPEQQRYKYFYAEAEGAELYEKIADDHTPLFSLMHSTILQLVENHVRRTSAGRPFSVLDIGSGTGVEALSLLERFPECRVVALDIAEPMHAVLLRKGIHRLGSSFSERCEMAVADVASAGCDAAFLRSALVRRNWGTNYDICVSALALHHLDSDSKATAYRRVADVLRPGGVLINADFCSFQSSTMSADAEAFQVSWMRECIGGATGETDLAIRTVGREPGELAEAWVRHVLDDNKPEPIEGSENASAHQGQKGQAGMLFEAGFCEVAVPFRYWQLAVLWALK